MGPRAFRRQADPQRREPRGCADGVSHGQQRGAREGDKERPRAEPTSVTHTPNSREEGAERSKRKQTERTGNSKCVTRLPWVSPRPRRSRVTAGQQAGMPRPWPPDRKSCTWFSPPWETATPTGCPDVPSTSVKPELHPRDDRARETAHVFRAHGAFAPDAGCAVSGRQPSAWAARPVDPSQNRLCTLRASKSGKAGKAGRHSERGTDRN